MVEKTLSRALFKPNFVQKVLGHQDVSRHQYDIMSQITQIIKDVSKAVFIINYITTKYLKFIK